MKFHIILSSECLGNSRLGSAWRRPASSRFGLDELVAATPDAGRVLSRSVERMALSARAAHRLLRVARTIADLEGGEKVGPAVMAEAVGFRVEC